MAGRQRNLAVRAALGWILEAVFPPSCASCGREGAWLCDPCARSVAWMEEQACPFCHDQASGWRTCRACAARHWLDGAWAVARYEKPVTCLVQAMKFQGVMGVSRALPSLLSGRVVMARERDAMLVPVPIHRRRRAERGFNQSGVIARCLEAELGLTAMQPLVRTRHTGPQVGKERAERLSNLRGAIRCSQGMKNKNIILVDDVLTTGATLDECARALKRRGAASVTAIVLARGQ